MPAGLEKDAQDRRLDLGCGLVIAFAAALVGTAFPALAAATASAVAATATATAIAVAATTAATAAAVAATTAAAAAVSTAAAAAIATTAAAAALLTLNGFRNAEGSAADLVAVEGADGCFAKLLILEGYERESPGASRVAVEWHVELNGSAEFDEKVTDLILSHGERQIAYE